jgi:adenylate cyclase
VLEGPTLADSADLKRRLAAIFAADAAGYSRLMAADDRATVAALDAARAVFRKEIESNDGRVVDMAGDSVLAVFETATGAVVAAIAVQAEINAMASSTPETRRMQFRIGVHLGDVVEKADGTVYGDGVNIAARLEGLADPGNIAISDMVYGAVRDRIAARFEDAGEHSVKNIARPVRAYRVCGMDEVVRASTTDARNSTTVGKFDLPLPDGPSIAVLPFTNISGDPEQEYFTDGITEDIITELSRFRYLFVIARNSSFSYKGKSPDIRQVGKELGVRYVLEGSIRRAGNRIRVTAQLVDTISGSHVWADRYDRVLEDIFAVQDEVMACIVAAIAPQIDIAEELRARYRPRNLSAHEVATRGIAMVRRAWLATDRTATDQALQLARESLAIDSECMLGLFVLSLAQWQKVVLKTAADRDGAWHEGMDAAKRLITLHKSYFGHGVQALLLACAPSGPRWDDALLEARAAYQGNPHDCWVASIYGMALSNSGNPQEGIRVLEDVLWRSPRDPFAYNTYTDLAYAHLHAKQYKKGLEWAARATSAAPSFVTARLGAALLYVGSGDLSKAREELDAARHLAPELVRARLERKSARPGQTMGARYDTWLRVAAGVESPSALGSLGQNE